MKNQKIIWLTAYYASIGFFILCTLALLLQNIVDVQVIFPEILMFSAKAGMITLAILLVFKNIGLIKSKHPIILWLKQSLPYQRELGLTAFFLFAGHTILSIYLVLFDFNTLIFQLASALLPIILFVFLWITSYRPVQSQVKGWKKKQSIIWFIVPFIALHEFLMNNTLSLTTIFSLLLIAISLFIGLIYSAKKSRTTRQLRFLSIGTLLIIAQFYVTEFLGATLAAPVETQTVVSPETTIEPSTAAVEETTIPVINYVYNDGTFNGTGTGYHSGLEVSVTIENDVILSVEILSNNETPRFADSVFATMPTAIVEQQSTDVADVSGATRTSEGIKEAVANALTVARK